MCGIVGYVGSQPAGPIVLESLQRLEYRGYDSAGICEVGTTLRIHKVQGRLQKLQEKTAAEIWTESTAIGHTRWATHGRPSDRNAHPHTDCSGRLAVVHNGIIENYYQLRETLTAAGHRFRSDTDTEVISHLLEDAFQGDLRSAVAHVLTQLQGSFALAAASALSPDTLVLAAQDSPLVIGRAADGHYLASDVPALLPYTQDVLFLEDGEMAEITAAGVWLGSFTTGSPVSPRFVSISWSAEEAQKDGYEHFMLKEMMQQPQAAAQTLNGRFDGQDKVNLDRELPGSFFDAIREVHFLACGTAFHACLYGRDLLRRYSNWQVHAELASEYRYNHLAAGPHTLAVAVSQSGETADTLGAVRRAKAEGAKVLAITNVVGSRLAREADAVILTLAGPEIAVASTKAYTTQLLCLSLLAAVIGDRQGSGPSWAGELPYMAERIQTVLTTLAQPLREAAAVLSRHNDCYFLGRGLDYYTAMEAQLKLKEISYLHAEALPAGELKHGTLALVEEQTPVIGFLTQRRLAEKMISNLKEVRARGGHILLLASDPEVAWNEAADTVLTLPSCADDLAPILSGVAGQMLAYFTASARGCDVDKPRNLAKSVTVE